MLEQLVTLSCGYLSKGWKCYHKWLYKQVSTKLAWHRTRAHCGEEFCSQIKSIRLSRGSEVSNNDYSIELYSCGENTEQRALMHVCLLCARSKNKTLKDIFAHLFTCLQGDVKQQSQETTMVDTDCCHF